MTKHPRRQCAFCGHTTTKGSMSRHLATCSPRQERIAAARKGKQQSLLHLRLQDVHGGAYWLDVEVEATANLGDLDKYLRAIWLECCGHMSRFSTGGWGTTEIPRARRVDAAFTGGVTELIHIYDFGTESVTGLTVVGDRHGVPLSRKPIVLMARNLAPEAACMECDKPASHLCQECQTDWEAPGVLCEEHAKTHPHEEYGEPITIVNSPRIGLCGYTGPADPPY